MASYRRKNGVWYYRFVDGDGRQRERKGHADLITTKAMARKAEDATARVRSGLIDLATAARDAHLARPLADHLTAWKADLIARGNTAKHADLYLDRAGRVAALVMGAALDTIDPGPRAKREQKAEADAARARLLKPAKLSDLTGERVQEALATLRDAGRSLGTCNHHRGAIRSFSRWCYRTGRTADDALRGVAGFNAREDRRHDRRTLSLPELRKLVAAAEAGPTYRKMTGPARALCYRLAVATGLSFSEIGAAVPESFDLTGDAPTVTIPAAYTKNGKAATLPLPADLADDLAAFVADVSRGSPVFPLPDLGAAMLRDDLDAAGIPYRDDAGLVFDFHALRCQCATLADAAGVSPRVVQRMMRHSTLDLTSRYTRPRVADLAGATSALPTLAPDRPGPEAAEAVKTGTTDQPIYSPFSLLQPYGAQGKGRVKAETGGTAPGNDSAPSERNPLTVTGVDASGRVCAETGQEYRRPDLNRRPAGYESVQAEGQPFDGARLVIHKATVAPFDSQESSPVTASCRLGEASMAPDLAAVVEAWPQLPEAIRAGIVAMVKATRPDDAR
jgi:integrase